MKLTAMIIKTAIRNVLAEFFPWAEAADSGEHYDYENIVRGKKACQT